MADIQHANISDDQLHECKGAATATLGQVLTATGAGTATFQNLPDDQIGTLTILDELEDSSSATQYVNANGAELQVTFSGTAFNSPNGSMSINAAGDITFNETGLYHVSISGSAGRETSGGFSEVAFSARANGSQIGETTALSIDSASDVFAAPIDVSYITEIPAPGVVLNYHLLGVDVTGNTGLRPTTIGTAGWNDVPSARVNITKLGVV